MNYDYFERIRPVRLLRFCAILALTLLWLQVHVNHASTGGAISTDVERVVAWTGAGGDSRWSNPANWDSGTVPRAQERVRFTADFPADAVVDPAFAGTVAALIFDEGYSGTVRLARDLLIADELQIRSGTLEGGSAALTVGDSATVSGGVLLTPGNRMTVKTLQIQSPGLVRMGANGKLNVTGDGTPLTGDGLLDTTAYRPNSVEYTGHATTDLRAAGPVHASSNANGALPLASTTFTRTGSLTLNAEDYHLSSAAIDTVNGFAYFGTYHDIAASVVKVRLSDFTRVGALTLNTGEDNLSAAVIDTANGFLYFSTWASPGMVVKVRLSDFTRVGALTLNVGEDYLHSAVIDTTNGFAYFGTGYATNPGTVVKVRLSDLTRVGALTLNAGEYDLEAAVIDTTGGFAYFGGNSRVVKVQLSDFTRVGAVSLSSGENQLSTAVIDTAAGFAYFGAPSVPGKVVKVRLSDFTRVGALTFNPGEDGLTSAVIDPAFGYAYFGADTSPGIVVRVRLSDFARQDALALQAGEDYVQVAVMDTTQGFAYFGTFNSPGIVAKINVGKSNLVLSHSANLVTANAGDSVTYALGITNSSLITATELRLTDTLPLSTTFASVTPGPTACSLMGGQIICSLGSLSPGASTHVAVRVSITGAGARLITNNATVSTSEPTFRVPTSASVNTLINPLQVLMPAVTR